MWKEMGLFCWISVIFMGWGLLLAPDVLAQGDKKAEENYTDCMKCHDKTLKPYKTMPYQHPPFKEEECSACHEAEHKKMVDTGEEVLCYQCHDTFGKKNFVHGPVATGKCNACHNPHAAMQPKILVKPKEELCGTCHDLKIGANPHKPVQERLCLDCHSPHASDTKAMLLAAPPDLCFKCHPRRAEEYVHGPYAAGACLACHTHHGGKEAKLTLMASNDLCLACHQDFVERLGLPTVHGAITQKGCPTCHDPHTSGFRFQLHKETKELCLGCHEKIKQTLTTAKVGHDPVTRDTACRNCHDPHSSQYNALLLQTEKNLCLACHKESLKNDRGELLTNIVSLLEDAKDHHGPIRENLCSPCHNPHGSENYRLLRQAYPAKFYAPFALELYSLCFTCHDPKLVVEEKTKQVTNFRNGDVNLHFRHVNQKKGRTCRACHEVHASHWPKHIRYAVPYGESGWQLPLNYKKDELGGSCLPGCHRQYGYNRQTPVVNRKEPR